MSILSTPSSELAAKLLAEADYADRLVGMIMTPMAGNVEQPIWSLKEAAAFLHVDQDLFHNQASIRYLDLTVLQRWICEVYSDQELATAIGTEANKYQTYVEKIKPVKELLLERIKQCETLVSA